jgi:catechol 2,3-dioxygenase-like lactoylglutathione lyase family enzyme
MLNEADATVVLAVKDIDEAKKFYEETLGLKKEKEDEGGVLYRSGSSKVYVYPSEFAGTNKATAAAWSVNDLEAVVQELQGKGVKFEEYDNLPGSKRDGVIHSWGDYKTSWFKDPSGNILAIDGGVH